MRTMRLLLVVVTTASTLASSEGNALVSLHHILKDNIMGDSSGKVSIKSHSRIQDVTSKQFKSKFIFNSL